MSQRASMELRSGHPMDAPVTVSNIAFFHGVQAGYQAYRQEPAPLNDHDLYEYMVHRLLAFPDSASESNGWVIGWVKGLLEGASPEQPSTVSRGRRSEVPAPYGDNFLLVLPTDTPLHSIDNPYCYHSSCPCHQDRDGIIEAVQHVKDGLMTPDEAINFILGKHL
ncbi:hypothetical protein [Ktedonobacter racemifer]|nr:hypothetical protein [Ktedonobacter racemifer]